MQCILNIPFRGNHNDLLGDHTSWLDLYSTSDYIDINLYDCDSGDIVDIHEKELNNPDTMPLNTFEIVSGHRNGGVCEELGSRLVDVSGDWHEVGDGCPSLSEVQDFLKIYKKSQVASNDNFSTDIQFSEDQAALLKIVDSQLTGVDNCPKRCLVQGKAGSGKSTVIAEIVRRVEKVFGVNSIAIAAPTGVAALNVDGKTIHSLLKIPISCHQWRDLDGKKARDFQLQFKDLKFLIIDEMSMVGSRLIYFTERRCRQMHPNVDDYFGGLFVYMFGDFLQLPPVSDTPAYAKSCNMSETVTQGLGIWKSFQKHFKLTTSHRQAEDIRGFSGMLDRLANGKFTDEDFELLMTRRQAILPAAEIRKFSDAIHLYPYNKSVDLKNTQVMIVPL